MNRSEQTAGAEQGGGGLVFPGLWWHQPRDRPGFVELVARPAELDDILADARFAFPAFVAAIQRRFREEGHVFSTSWRSQPEMAQGFFNLLTLAMALTNKIGQVDLDAPPLSDAFHAAFRGRLKLIPYAPDSRIHLRGE